MHLVGNSWDQILEDEYHKDYFKKIVLYINKAYKEREIYPPKNYILPRFNKNKNTNLVIHY